MGLELVQKVPSLLREPCPLPAAHRPAHTLQATAPWCLLPGRRVGPTWWPGCGQGDGGSQRCKAKPALCPGGARWRVRPRSPD